MTIQYRTTVSEKRKCQLGTARKNNGNINQIRLRILHLFKIAQSISSSG